MSVHGEYGRALEALISRVRLLDSPERHAWLRELESTRVAQHPDLSAAARACLATLERLEGALPELPDPGAIATPFEHLVAHCRIVLGLPPA